MPTASISAAQRRRRPPCGPALASSARRKSIRSPNRLDGRAVDPPGAGLASAVSSDLPLAPPACVTTSVTSAGIAAASWPISAATAAFASCAALMIDHAVTAEQRRRGQHAKLARGQVGAAHIVHVGPGTDIARPAPARPAPARRRASAAMLADACSSPDQGGHSAFDEQFLLADDDGDRTRLRPRPARPHSIVPRPRHDRSMPWLAAGPRAAPPRRRASLARCERPIAALACDQVRPLPTSGDSPAASRSASASARPPRRDVHRHDRPRSTAWQPATPAASSTASRSAPRPRCAPGRPARSGPN